MNREIIQLDVTDIEDRGWTWTISQGTGARHFVAYVHFVDYSLDRADWGAEGEEPCVHAYGDTPQGALDNAYREAMAHHCAVCYAPLGVSSFDCCSVQCETEREARKVLA